MTANSQMISVVAPNLNEPHLLMFLDSLLLQTFKDFEVIIVDGGSTDRNLWILSNYFNVFTKMGIPFKIIVDETRNFGYIRNLGASHSIGDVMLHCNSDNYLPPTLLEDLDKFFREHPETLSVSGRVYPMGTSIFEHLSYQLFDFVRFIFTCAPCPIKKYRPSGSFVSMRSKIFRFVNGFPEVTCNEDGLFGQKLDEYAKGNHRAVMFSLKMYVGHHAKKFKQMGGPQAIMFYFYTIGNFFPMLKPLLNAIQRNAGLIFQGKIPERLTFKMVLQNLWNWM